jgi:hypothetical protein
VVVEEVRPSAPLVQHAAGDPVDAPAVDTPGRMAARVASCISATTRPARRILASSSAVTPHPNPLPFCRRWVSMTLTIRRVTASGDPVPDTVSSWLRDRYHSMSGAVWIS